MARHNQPHRKEERRESAKLRQENYSKITDAEKLTGKIGTKERSKIERRMSDVRT